MRRQVAVVCTLMVLLAGCTGQRAPVSTGSASPSRSSASPGAARPPHGTVSADAVYLGMPVHLHVHPLEVKDGVALLTVDYALDDNNKALLPQAVLDRVNAIKADIIAGKIVVPDYYKEPHGK